MDCIGRPLLTMLVLTLPACSKGASVEGAQGRDERRPIGLYVQMAPAATAFTPNDVPVWVTVHNSGNPRRFHDVPGFYSFEVVSSRGDTLHSITNVFVDGSVPPLTVLPRGDSLVHNVNLACGHTMYGAAVTCEWAFPFSPGETYHVRVRYATPAPPDGRPSPPGSALLLTSNVLTIKVGAP